MTDYIEIRNWDRFQHTDATKRGRDPVWIKAYTRLLSDDDYLSLSGHRRAILHGLWLEYARSGRRLRLDTASITRRLDLRVTTADITAIENQGFITIRQDNGVTASILDKSRGESVSKETDAPTPKRTTDELWEALVEAMRRQPETAIERKRWNAALKELRQAGATAPDILGRAAAYRREWPDVELSPHGLASNWSRFGSLRLVAAHRCDVCGVEKTTAALLVDHLRLVHEIEAAA